MKWFTVRAKSPIGRHAITDHGDQWRVVFESDQAASIESRDGDRRWIAYNNDEDFEIVPCGTNGGDTR